MEKLTDVMAKLTPEMRDMVNARHAELMTAELATLWAEVERLREALKVIENTTYDVAAEKLAKEALK